MLWSDLKGTKVVSTATADTVAKVAGLVVDPGRHHVIGLHLKKAENGSAVAWSDLQAVGQDAVTVADENVVVTPDGDLATHGAKDREVLKKRVLTTDGFDLGAIKDVELDPESGAVVSLILKDDAVAGERLVGIGSYAVVVKA